MTTNILAAVVTAYIAGHSAIDASGHRPIAGMTCAVPRELIPLGSTVIVNGRKWIATDKVNKRFHRTIDLYFGHDRAAAVKWGRKEMIVKIISP